MSYWTEVFLAASLLEDDGPEAGPSLYPAIEYINDWLVDNAGMWPMFQIQAPHPDRHCPNACWVGHFKGLNRDGFVAAVQSAPWRWPEQVQLFLRTEDGCGFVEMPGKTSSEEFGRLNA